jgi:hypothetical protein
MEGSCEYIEQAVTENGPPAWGLGEVLTTPHRKNVYCYEIFTKKKKKTLGPGLTIWYNINNGKGR